MKIEGVPPVVECVEDYGEVLVLGQSTTVPTHFIGHHPLRMTVPTAARDIDVLVIEEHPDLGFFRCRLAFLRLLLKESADARYVLINGFFELPVDYQRRVQSHRPHRHPSLIVAGNHLWKYRRRWTINVSGSV